MRTSPIILALPALSLAQDQIPLFDKLKGFFNQATAAASAYIPTNIPSSVPEAVNAGAAKASAQFVPSLNLSNWQSIVTPSASAKSTGPEEWLVYVTGGNKTCYGTCGNATAAWNKAAPVLSASTSGPKLAVVDCETEQILCNTWAAGPPAIYHFLLPKPLADQTKPATTVRYIPLNRTTVSAKDIIDISTKQKYLETAPYEGYFHPFDGLLATTGANLPLAYGMWALALMPSWAPMILISLFSRTFMGRRMPQGGTAPAPAAAAPQ